MKPDSAWQRKVRELCDAALDLDPSERRVFLDAACDGDEKLREEIESLLEHEETARDFLAQPAWKQFAEQVARQGAPLEGRELGHYRIQDRLGAGGMGEVWRAWDEQLKRGVAIKILPPEFSADVERVHRFEQEAYTISALNHPNILTIHEVGHVTEKLGELHFIVTEFIEGQTLRDCLRQSRPSWREAVLVATQIASALNAAHTAGIIHRDIKPENVMVQASGHVKVLDFGIARWVHLPAASSAGSAPPVAGIQTKLGARPGTLKYMSPEQARGEQLDAQSDIFSLGLLLYEMLAGRHPYGDSNDEEIIAALKSEEEIPPVTGVNDAIPAALDRIVAKTLKKRREERCSSTAEMMAELGQLQSLIEVSRGERGQRLFKAQNANQLLTQFVVLYDADKTTRMPLGGWWSVWRFADLKQGRLERELMRRSLLSGLARAGLQILLVAAATMVVAAVMSVGEEWDEIRLKDGHTAAVRRAIFSPDGRLLVSVGEDAKVIVWDFARRQRMTTFTDHTGRVTSVAFSPDGKWFATGSADKTVIVWNTSRLEKTGILRDHQGPVYAIAISPDGRLLAAATGYETIVWDIGKRERVTELPYEGADHHPLFFSPDSKRLLLANHLLIDIATGKLLGDGLDQRLASGNWEAFLPDGALMVDVGSDGNVAFWDVTKLWESGQYHFIRQQRAHRDNGRAVAFSPDGQLVATGAEDIVLWDATTQTSLVRLEHTAIVWSLAFSPDGRWLVSTHGDGAILLWDVAERKRVANLNEHSGAVRAVAFSPDAKRIASASEDRSVIIWDAEHGQKEAVLVGHDTRVMASAFAPDGSWLASCDMDGHIILWDIAKRQERLSFNQNPQSFSVAISPDGRWIATTWGVHDSVSGHRLIDFRDLPQLHLSLQMYGVAFSADGRLLACVSPSGFILLWDAQKWQLLSYLEARGQLVSVSFSPDANRLVTGSDDGTVRLWETRPLREVAVIGRHTARVKSVAFSPDSKQVASASDDQTIAFWDLSGHLVMRIGTHTAPVLSVAFSPDGKQLVSGEHDHSVRLYTRHRALWGHRLD